MAVSEYTRVNWESYPSENTPMSAANLNKMDAGIKENNDAIKTNETNISNLQTSVGNTDISGIGDGTVSGAISELNSNLDNKVTKQRLYASWYGLPASSDSANAKVFRVSFPNGIKPTSINNLKVMSPAHKTYTVSSYSIGTDQIVVSISTTPNSSEMILVTMECYYN